MTDIFDKKKRSLIMSSIRSQNNRSTELKLIDFFKSNGITGWKRNYKVKGKPDFIFPKERIAIFTDGCFWHGHDCRDVHPKINQEFWEQKIANNKCRDKKNTAYLEKLGWTVIRIWECELKKKNLIRLIIKLEPLLISKGLEFYLE